MPDTDPERAAREEARRIQKEAARPGLMVAALAAEAAVRAEAVRVAAEAVAEAARIAALPPEPEPAPEPEAAEPVLADFAAPDAPPEVQ